MKSYKGVPFEVIKTDEVVIDKEQVSIGELALNHMQFTILEELQPGS